jgi:anti-anti-sigma factor
MAAHERPIVSSQHVGEIVILRLETDGLLRISDTDRFSDEATQAIGARSHIVFDMAQVRWPSSVLWGKLIMFASRSKRRGGEIVLCHLHDAVRQSVETSNLDRLFHIASSLEEAIAALSWCLAIECPVAGCAGEAFFCDPSIADRGADLCCRSCGCQFRVAPFQLPTSGEAPVTVSQFAIPTYEQEQIRAELGAFVFLHIVGRLDLFASEALFDAWRSLPAPRRILLDLRRATEVSDAALRLVKEHLRNEASADRVVALVDPGWSDRIRDALPDTRVTPTHDEAQSVLSDSLKPEETPASLLVSARAVKRTAEQIQSRDAASQAGDPGQSSSVSARAVQRTAEQIQSRDAASQAGDPGPSSPTRGWQKFLSYLTGWSLARGATRR